MVVGCWLEKLPACSLDWKSGRKCEHVSFHHLIGLFSEMGAQIQVRASCWRRVMACQYSSSSIHKSISSQPKAQNECCFLYKQMAPCWCYKISPSINLKHQMVKWNNLGENVRQRRHLPKKNYMSQTLRIQTCRQFQWKDPEQSKKSWKRSAAPMRFVVKTSIKEFPTKPEKQSETTSINIQLDFL